MVHVPSRQAEDDRQLHRDLLALKTERTQHINRIKGLLISQGVSVTLRANFPDLLESIRLWDGYQTPEALGIRLQREYQRWLLVNQQIDQLRVQREELLKTSRLSSVEQVRELTR